MIRFCLSYFFLLLIHPALFAQQVVLSGKVLNDKEQPLEGASIRLKVAGTGTITNRAGDFMLRIPAAATADTLEVSYLGYSSYQLSLAGQDVLQNLDILLHADTGSLAPVIVTAVSPLQIVESAVAKIPVNYIDQPHITHGFYRIDTRKGESHIMLSEAVFDIRNAGYASAKKKQFRLQKMRAVQDERASHGLDLGLKPESLYEYDLIGDPDASGLLGRKALKKYRFQLDDIIEYNRVDTYVIGFDQKDGLKESLYKGKLYIAVKSFAIMAVDLSLSPKGIAYAQYGNGATRSLMKLLGLSIDVQQKHLLVQYHRYGHQWALGSVTEKNRLRFKSGRQFYDFVADIDVDYVVTGIDTSGIEQFSAKEELGKNKFIEFQQEAYQKDFWKEYNIVLADYNSDTIAREIQERNESYQLKKQAAQLLSKTRGSLTDRIDTLLGYYYNKGAFNGSVLVRKGDALVLQKGYGVARKTTHQPATDTTQYRLGSLTKPFTALIIQQLAQEQQLSLADTVGKFLPGYVHGGVTIAQLLTHTSGIPNYTNKDEYLYQVMTKAFTLSQIVRNFCSDSLDFEEGTQFRYSNAGYVVLAAVVEAVTQKSYGQVLAERIFKPLEMTRSGFAPDTINSTGYWMGEPEPLYKTANVAGAGGIVSTTQDLLKWEQAWASGRLLSQAAMEEALTPRAEYRDWDAFYGYGWMIDRKLFRQSADHKIVYHPGTDIGYYTMFVRQPDDGNLIILLSNTGDFPRFDLADLLLDELNR